MTSTQFPSIRDSVEVSMMITKILIVRLVLQDRMNLDNQGHRIFQPEFEFTLGNGVVSMWGLR